MPAPNERKQRTARDDGERLDWNDITIYPWDMRAGQRNRASLPINARTYCRDAAKRCPSELASLAAICSLPP
jgi:hypothetical protein